MHKIVINNCYGGFSLSPIAIKRFYELKGILIYFYTYDKSTLYRKDHKLRECKYIKINPEATMHYINYYIEEYDPEKKNFGNLQNKQ